MIKTTRAYAVVHVKDFLAGGRRFVGVASTIGTDRMGDVVEPRGMQAKLPVALLWQHDSSHPIGWVRSTRVSDSEIEVDCEVATAHEPGPLQERLDVAWQSIQTRLVRGLSIGFRPLESARIEGTGGTRYTKWELLELSAVTIPANADCSIQNIKAIDQQQRRKAASPASPASPGDVLVRLTASQVPATLGMLTMLGQKMVDGIKVRDARIKDLGSRLDKAMQRLAALEKQVAAEARKGPQR